jgi:hypothetical protein
MRFVSFLALVFWIPLHALSESIFCCLLQLCFGPSVLHCSELTHCPAPLFGRELRVPPPPSYTPEFVAAAPAVFTTSPYSLSFLTELTRSAALPVHVHRPDELSRLLAPAYGTHVGRVTIDEYGAYCVCIDPPLVVQALKLQVEGKASAPHSRLLSPAIWHDKQGFWGYDRNPRWEDQKFYMIDARHARPFSELSPHSDGGCCKIGWRKAWKDPCSIGER